MHTHTHTHAHTHKSTYAHSYRHHDLKWEQTKVVAWVSTQGTTFLFRVDHDDVIDRMIN
jgi:hypothetical protein